MHASLQLVERYQELLTRRDDQLPYDFRTMFPDGGVWTRRASQKRLKLLKRIDESLRAMLRPNERVVFLTQAVTHSFWESYLLGVPMYYLNRRALVLTNERLILIQIDSRRRPLELRSQVALGAITGMRRTALGNSLLQLTSGARCVFVHMPRRDRKIMVELLAEAVRKAAAVPHGRLEELCPFCFEPVEESPTLCPHCSGTLKSWHKAGLLSLLFPGLGQIYLGHRGFAAGEILVAAIVWANILLPLVAPGSGPPTPAGEVAFTVFWAFLILHGGDALGTFHVARKGHYPARPPAGLEAAAPRALEAR